jgi:hypothetical protein
MGEGPASSMLRAIEELANTFLSEQLKGMFDNANKLLFEMADQAKNNTEQRLYLDTMRIVRLEQPRLLRTFQESLRQAFATMHLEHAAAETDLEDLSNWSLQKAEDVEERIVLSNLESKVEGMFKNELYELEQRLTSMDPSGSGAVPAKFMTPAHLFSAFRDTLHALEADFQIKRVIYRLFEQTVVGNLGAVFSGANKLLAEGGIEPATPQVLARRRMAQRGGTSQNAAPATLEHDPGPAGDVSDPDGGDFKMPSFGAANAGGGSAPGQSRGGGGFAGASAGASASGHGGGMEGFPGATQTGGGQGPGMPTWGSGMDINRLMEALSRAPGMSPQTSVYTDAELAGEMAETLHALSQGRNFRSWMPAPNLALVGRMFDSLYRDPRLPGPLKPVLGRLQYPVMKAALADPEFFEKPEHPVRVLVNDVFEMLAGARGARPADVKRLEELIENVLGEFDVDPSRFSRMQQPPRAVNDEEADKFLAQQGDRLWDHRRKILQKVRRLVAQELQLRTVGRRVPQSVMPLLLSGFGPMLAVQFMRGGADCTEWNESIELLQDMLDSLQPVAQVDMPQEREARQAGIEAALTTRLLSVGVAEPKVQDLLAGLVLAYQEMAEDIFAAPKAEATPEEAAAASAAADDEARKQTDAIAHQALTVILTPGTWFKVWDMIRGEQRWLKLSQYYGAQDTVVFTDFSGQNLLRMRAMALVNDLLNGRSEPVDPDMVVQKSLKLLGPLAAEASACNEPPLWMPAAEAAEKAVAS